MADRTDQGPVEEVAAPEDAAQSPPSQKPQPKPLPVKAPPPAVNPWKKGDASKPKEPETESKPAEPVVAAPVAAPAPAPVVADVPEVAIANDEGAVTRLGLIGGIRAHSGCRHYAGAEKKKHPKKHHGRNKAKGDLDDPTAWPSLGESAEPVCIPVTLPEMCSNAKAMLNRFYRLAPAKRPRRAKRQRKRARRQQRTWKGRERRRAKARGSGCPSRLRVTVQMRRVAVAGTRTMARSNGGATLARTAARVRQASFNSRAAPEARARSKVRQCESLYHS